MNAEVECVNNIAPGEALRQLERLLANRRFVASGRGAKFLQYVVERTLAGCGDEIKEVIIAMEVYGRTSDYNPKIDSVVRVEATRLRAKLKSYYDEEGAFDPVRISIPKGRYTVTFERNEPPAAEQTVSPELTSPVFGPEPAQLPQHDVQPPPPVAQRPEPRFTTRAGQVSWASLLAVLLSCGWLAGQAWSNSRPVNSGLSKNPDAVAAWQEGMHLVNLDPHTADSQQGVPQTLQRAIDRFEHAVKQDPEFVPAWTSLAEAYDYASGYVGRDWNQDVRRAETAARRAIALDSKFAPAHAMLALIQGTDRFDFSEAEQSYRRALSLDPRLPYATAELVDLLRETGRFNEARAQLIKARELLPNFPVLASKQAELELDSNQLDAAIATATSAISMKRDYGRAYVVRGTAHERKGDTTAALSDYLAASEMKGEERRAFPALGYLYARMGRVAEAKAVLRQLEIMNSSLRNCAFQIAVVHAGLGNDDLALNWLERAHQSRQALIPFAAVEYRLERLRGHARLQAIFSQLRISANPVETRLQDTSNEPHV